MSILTRKLMITFGVIISISILITGLFYSNYAQSEPSLTENEVKDIVSDQYPGKITDLNLKNINNQSVYEVLVTHENSKYNIKIDRHSGEILDIIRKSVAVKENNNKEAPKKDIKKQTDKQTNNTPPKTEENPKQSKKQEKNKQVKNKKETAIKKKNTPPKKEENPKQSKKKEKNEQVKNEKETAVKEEKREEEHEANVPKEQPKTAEKPKEENKSTPKESTDTKETVLSISEVSNIALSHFSGSIDDVELEDEDGRLYYEVEIERDEQEAEMKIDAYTGEVIVIEIEE